MGSSSEAPSGTTPARAERPKRPWYLIVVLALAWLTGAGSVVAGCQKISLYRTTSLEIAQQIDRASTMTEAEQTETHERFEKYTAALDRAKTRNFPLNVADLLVGAAMVMFAQRAMVGKEWGRSLLIQMTLAHAALAGLAYLLTPDVLAAYAELQAFSVGVDTPFMTRALAVSTGLGALTSLMIIVGLTRRGSRSFYLTAERLSQG